MEFRIGILSNLINHFLDRPLADLNARHLPVWRNAYENMAAFSVGKSRCRFSFISDNDCFHSTTVDSLLIVSLENLFIIFSLSRNKSEYPAMASIYRRSKLQ